MHQTDINRGALYEKSVTVLSKQLDCYRCYFQEQALSFLESHQIIYFIDLAIVIIYEK